MTLGEKRQPLCGYTGDVNGYDGQPTNMIQVCIKMAAWHRWHGVPYFQIHQPVAFGDVS